jgi:hypothetical protein
MEAACLLGFRSERKPISVNETKQMNGNVHSWRRPQTAFRNTEFLSQCISGLGSKSLLHSDVHVTRRFHATPLVLPILNHEAEGVSSLQGDLVSKRPKHYNPVARLCHAYQMDTAIYVVCFAALPKGNNR